MATEMESSSDYLQQAGAAVEKANINPPVAPQPISMTMECSVSAVHGITESIYTEKVATHAAAMWQLPLRFDANVATSTVAMLERIC